MLNIAVEFNKLSVTTWVSTVLLLMASMHGGSPVKPGTSIISHNDIILKILLCLFHRRDSEKSRNLSNARCYPPPSP